MPQITKAEMPTRKGGQPCEPTTSRHRGPAAKPAEMIEVYTPMMRPRRAGGASAIIQISLRT